MAASKMKNDFAPAWLKIPNQENLKPTPPRSGVDRAYERSFSEQAVNEGRIESMFDDINLTPRVARQRSNSNRSGLSNGFHGSNNGSIQRPRARPGRTSRSFNQMSSVGCELVPADRPNRLQLSAGQDYNERSPSGSSSGGQKGGRVSGQKQLDTGKHHSGKSAEDEFPSLNGDSFSSKPSYSKVASVWDGSVRESGNSARAAPITPESAAPKTLVLKTSGLKRPVGDAVDKKPAVDIAKLNQRNGHKEPAVMLTAKVLNACLKQPKESSDRKSNFFKLMRRESHESGGDVGLMRSPTTDHDASVIAEQFLSNGGNGETADHDGRDSALQSPTASISSPVEVVFSSEGELRLMHEMGWNEADYDGEEYEITDDDVREFQALCRKLQQEQQLSCGGGRGNGGGFVKSNGYLSKILASLGQQQPSYSNQAASSVDSDFSVDDSDSSNS